MTKQKTLPKQPSPFSKGSRFGGAKASNFDKKGSVFAPKLPRITQHKG